MSIQSINNASMAVQAMSAAPARNQTESAASLETRPENVQQNASPQEQAQRVPSAGELQKALEEVEKAVAPMAPGDLRAEHGPDIPVVDDFVKAAGVSRGTFYNYFKSTSELFEAIAASARS